ncbi:MAG: type II toxin-antitoxin system HicB family antitoxin [Candidatus Kapaibacterium sp.]|jgi:predicted RNase H-like HicB family nuclease|nr:type II toxin-antitoxin system HicB family antitoxin [Candidatus Kapabacteria bacterium]
MKFSIEYDLEDDGRWIAEIPSIPGVLAYGIAKEDAATKAITLAIDVLT